MSALAEEIGERAACSVLGASRATMQRHRNGKPSSPKARPPSHRRLNVAERQEMLDIAHSERFCDQSIREIYATLLDEGRYLASISTWYRVLRSVDETRERRRQATHPARVKPELVATKPGEVWSWDITKLLGPAKWTYYYLYVVLDIFSRYVVAWRLENRESATLARELIAEAISESQFKTLKYGPGFPPFFANLEQGRDFCRAFFPWYNEQHRHTGLALLTPSDVHHGLVEGRIASRRNVLHAAWAAHPERFVRGEPQPATIAQATYINRPEAA